MMMKIQWLVGFTLMTFATAVWATPKVVSESNVGENVYKVVVEASNAQEVKNADALCRGELNAAFTRAQAKNHLIYVQSDCVWSHKDGKWLGQGTLSYQFENSDANVGASSSIGAGGGSRGTISSK